MHTDQLSISTTPPRLTVNEGDTAQLNATASGININNFVYQWRKRGSSSLPNKVTGINGTILTIPNAHDSDEGNYVCIVTNEWGSSVRSNNIMLTVTGMYMWQYSLYLCKINSLVSLLLNMLEAYHKVNVEVSLWFSHRLYKGA